MASGTRALGSAREPEAWKQATDAARVARSTVAGQIADLLVASSDVGGTGGVQMTGGFELVTRRVRELGEARRQGDPLLIRAAAMALAVANGQLVVRLDLQQDHPAAYR